MNGQSLGEFGGSWEYDIEKISISSTKIINFWECLTAKNGQNHTALATVDHE